MTNANDYSAYAFEPTFSMKWIRSTGGRERYRITCTTAALSSLAVNTASGYSDDRQQLRDFHTRLRKRYTTLRELCSSTLQLGPLICELGMFRYFLFVTVAVSVSIDVDEAVPPSSAHASFGSFMASFTQFTQGPLVRVQYLQ